MLYILGIGPGNTEYCSLKSNSIIKEADILIGGKRNLENIENERAERFFIGADLNKMKEYILSNKNSKIAVIASGDPSLYGIGSFIVRELTGKIDFEIVPGISSIQYAFSIFKIDMNDVYITSSHGRMPDFDFIMKHDKIAMVTDSKIGPREIAGKVIEYKKEYRMFVGENLSYDNEVLTEGTPQEILKKEKYSMSVVILKKIK